MGKRKKSSRGPQGPKKKQPLPQNFQCLFCNDEKAVTVKLDRKAGVGSLSCKLCGQNFQSNINFLSEGVDVYSSWIDACDAAEKGTAKPKTSADEPASAYRGTMRGAKDHNDEKEADDGAPDEYEQDDFVVQDEDNMEGAYGGADDDDVNDDD